MGDEAEHAHYSKQMSSTLIHIAQHPKPNAE